MTTKLATGNARKFKRALLHALMGNQPAIARYWIPARRRAPDCCSRIASVNTSNPGMLSFWSSSMKPRRRRPSMSAAFWFRTEPPPNSLINRRCSDLVNASQGTTGIFMLPVIQDQRAAIMIAYAANARRTAADSNCSPAGVNREPLTNPMRLTVRRATGSHKSVETPSANIAMARCSSEVEISP